MAGTDSSPALSELPLSAIRLIGSGQVVTSVYSVVKELFENSVDASSTSIDIKLDDFGLERIEVCDNGRGVKTSDVPFMAKRHYTSKLSQMDDLLSLETYGFRGEALASLCAVAIVTVATKTIAEDFSTVHTFDHDGNVTSSKPSHLGKGTTVTARQLFHNLPVRKQYYKTSQKKKEDLRRIEDLIVVFGIIKPRLRITLKHGSDLLHQKLPLSDRKGVIHAVLGRQVASQLLYREQSLPELKGSVTTFLPKPGSDVKTMSRNSSDRTFIVVNDRPVHVKKLVQLLKRYYVNCHACDSARFPICFIDIKLPIPDVDVNLDPNKSTVFLRPMTEVCNSVEELLLQIYGPLDNVPPWRYTEASENNNKGDLKACSKSSQLVTHPKDANSAPAKTSRGILSNTNHSADSTLNTSLLPSIHLKERSKAVLITDSLQSKEKESATTKETNIQDEISFPNDDDLLLNVLEEEAAPSRSSELVLSEATVDSTNIKDTFCKDIGNIGDEVLESVMSNDAAVLVPHQVPRQMESRDVRSSEMQDWSEGHVRDTTSGKLIQPVQLLAPTSRHTPGKRPLSPTSGELDKPSPKQRPPSSMSGTLSSGQGTLRDMFSSATTVAVSGLRENSCGKNHASGLGVHRETKDISEKKTKEPQPHKSNSVHKSSVRNQVAAQASQSQAEKANRSLKDRLYHAEKNVPCTLGSLTKAVKKNKENPERLFFEGPIVLGHAEHCDAWLCCYGNSLGILNAYRLAENILYEKLRKKHRLSITPLEQSIPLSSRNLSQSQLLELERLGKDSCDPGSFEITDNRLVANGFDVKCYFDRDTFLPELFGVCNMVPTYGVKDLGEILDKLKNNPSADLASARPTKVLYYLQGEAARMNRQSIGQKSLTEIQDMLNQLKNNSLKTDKCFHDKVLFHDIFNLNDLCMQDSLTQDW